MRRLTLTPWFALLVLVEGMMACGGGFSSLNETLSLWHSGHRAVAQTQTATEYARFRDANDLDEARVRGWADALADRVDEEPIVATRERPGALVAERAVEGPGTLDRGIRADVLSREASRVARALGVIRGLALRQHAVAIIGLVFDHEVIVSDGDVLSDLNGAERTVTIKRMALDTLAALE